MLSVSPLFVLPILISIIGLNSELGDFEKNFEKLRIIYNFRSLYIILYI